MSRKSIYIATGQMAHNGRLLPNGLSSPWRYSKYSAEQYAKEAGWPHYRIAKICFCYAYRRKIAKLWLKQADAGLTEQEQSRLRVYYRAGSYRFAQDAIIQFWRRYVRRNPH